MWTKDEMKTHQEADDDLRILYQALATEGMARPEWKDVSFESLACKYYHGEWNRLRRRKKVFILKLINIFVSTYCIVSSVA